MFTRSIDLIQDKNSKLKFQKVVKVWQVSDLSYEFRKKMNNIKDFWGCMTETYTNLESLQVWVLSL